MPALSLSLLFIFNVALALCLVVAYRSLSEKSKRQEQRLSESLDDLDLVEFQESVSGLLQELKRVGDSLVRQAEDRQTALKGMLEQCQVWEDKLAHQSEALERQAVKLAEQQARQKAEEKAVEKAVRPVAAEKVESAVTVVVAPAPRPALPAVTAPLVEAAAPVVQPAPALPLSMTAISAAFQDRLVHVEPAAKASSRSERYQAVYELAEQNLPVEEIARKTRVLPGEVELILSLKPSRYSPLKPAAEKNPDLDDN